MSEYNVIHAVGETLKDLLWATMQHDSTISGSSGINLTVDQISFEPPFKLVKDVDSEINCLSLYLYRIVENEDMKNRPPEKINTSFLRYPPLSLTLFYLITPLTNSADNDQKLLGKTMQILYDNAIVKGAALQELGVLQDTAEELRIILNPVSMEDITKLWSAFMRSYRLSVSYEVKVIYIDSERETAGERVHRKQIEFKQSTGV